MSRSVQLIRLSASGAIAFAACWFVSSYDQASYIRYPFDHPTAEGYREPPDDAFGQFIIGNRPGAGDFVTAHRTHAYIVPVIGLLMGVTIICRWPKHEALIELIIAILSVLSFLWAASVLIVWQIQNIPLFHGMQWHY